MHRTELLDVYSTIKTARLIDEQERTWIAQSRAHFHVSGAGHEGSAVLARHLTEHDWLHLHYRDKALLLARGVPVDEFFLSLRGAASSHSAGRQMSAHLSSRQRNVLSLVGPVGNNALQAVGVAEVIRDHPERPLVVCSVGDGTTQQGEFLEAMAEAVRNQLPVLFLVHNNRYAISTPTTGRTFFSLPIGDPGHLFGLSIQHVDGSDVKAVDFCFREVTEGIRRDRGPRLVVMNVERLCDHTNSDDQRLYREKKDLQRGQLSADPLAQLRHEMLNGGISESHLQDCDREIAQSVGQAASSALLAEDPIPAVTATAEYPPEIRERLEYLGHDSGKRLTMRESLRDVLHSNLQADARVFLYGQDIEDPKGDVFGVTRGLSTLFPGRVVNAPLSESTIVGTAIGRALAGQRPVAFIQFADFLPLAWNQIVSELASMFWRTNGSWQCPVIVMATCGAYKPGLGPFHAQSMEAYCAHIPGLDVFIPSTASDAAGLLNAAFASPRPTVFLYPKSGLNLPDRSTSADVAKQFAQPGKAFRRRSGNDLTLVAWGNTVALCETAADHLQQVQINCDVLDLRTLSPWDRDTVLESARRTGRLIVVHEDNLTSGFGAEVVASVTERSDLFIVVRRISRPDTFIPYHFGNQVQLLPSLDSILTVCCELTGCELNWHASDHETPGQRVIRAIGSGPADEMVDLVSLKVQVGDVIQPGQVIAEIEASKSVVDIVADCHGKVLKVLVTEGQRVRVNAPLVIVASDETRSESHNSLPPTAVPTIQRSSQRKRSHAVATLPHTAPQDNSGDELMPNGKMICLSKPEVVTGGQTVTTESIAAGIPGWTTAEAIKRTGIKKRPWVTENETAVKLTLRAASQLLTRLGGQHPPIGAVICSTTTPQEATPSISCVVGTGLADHSCFAEHWYAFDLNAACSGFLYALRLAGQQLAYDPSSSVLLLTSELLSPNLNPSDPSTAFLFADAFTATLVTASPIVGRSLSCRVPFIRAAPDPDRVISSPCVGCGPLRMDGIAVARTAYKSMASILSVAVQSAGLSIADLAGIVPHPGSGRILQNVADLLEVPGERVWHTLNDTGNTSSSSIPIALSRYWNELPVSRPLGLVAFGAGFTSAATTGEMKIHE